MLFVLMSEMSFNFCKIGYFHANDFDRASQISTLLSCFLTNFYCETFTISLQPTHSSTHIIVYSYHVVSI